MNQHRHAAAIVGLASLSLLIGCPWQFEVPKLSSSIRSAPICAGAANNAEQQTIDELAEALRESGTGLLCWRGYWSAFPEQAAAAFEAAGVNPQFGRNGRFVVVHPSVAVTVYEWNADSTALVPTIHSEAPTDLNPCPTGLNWSGRWGYWRNDGQVEVIVNCGDPGSIERYPRLVFDPEARVWAVDTQAGNVRTSDYSPDVNLVADGKVTGADGNRYSVAFGRVHQVTAKYAVEAEGFRIQNLESGAIFDFGTRAFVNPSGTRLAVDDRNAGVVHLFDVGGDEPIQVSEIQTPTQWERLDGFPSDRFLAATAHLQHVSLGLPTVLQPSLLIDIDTGRFYNIGDSSQGALIRLRTDAGGESE